MFYKVQVTREKDSQRITNGLDAANAILEITEDLPQLTRDAEAKGKSSGKWNGYTFQVERVD